MAIGDIFVTRLISYNLFLLRESLVGPLFKLLGRCMSNEWVKIASSDEDDVREITLASISSIQQTVLLLLKDIFDSPNMNPLKVCFRFFYGVD